MKQDNQLVIEQLSKKFSTPAGDVQALKEINLSIKKGELITVIGPSGCGKSTLLKIIAGLDQQYDGLATLNGTHIQHPGRDRGFIFQEPRLFPWLNVERNIAADLSLREVENRRRVDEMLKLVHLEDFAKSYPKELSGGMAQRVAIARSLVRSPEVLLLDEPFGALDAFTRTHMQDVLLDIWKYQGTTMILVTHDIDEAVYLADRVVVMHARPGRIQRVIPIDLPHPRKKSGSSFLEFRQIVMNEFEQVEDARLASNFSI